MFLIGEPLRDGFHAIIPFSNLGGAYGKIEKIPLVFQIIYLIDLSAGTVDAKPNSPHNNWSPPSLSPGFDPPSKGWF
jgi:hypothetical protein